MKKKATIKLLLQSGLANPGPPVGPSLGSFGLNLMHFCKEFNEKSLEKTNQKKGIFVTAIVKIFDDKKFLLTIKTTPTSLLLKNFLNIEKGSKESKKNKVGVLSIEDIEKIVEMKKDELNTVSLESAKKIIVGTALSMGITIK